MPFVYQIVYWFSLSTANTVVVQLIGLIFTDIIRGIGNVCVDAEKSKLKILEGMPFLKCYNGHSIPRNLVIFDLFAYQSVPESMSFVDNVNSKCGVFRFTIESELVFWFAIGNFINLKPKQMKVLKNRSGQTVHSHDVYLKPLNSCLQ